MMKATLRLTLLALAALTFAACGSSDSESGESQAEPAAQRVEITVGASTYDPAEIHATAGTPLTLVFTRNTEDGCGTEVVIPSQNIREALPLNQAVEVSFTPTEAGNLRFSCGMDMFEGSIVVD